MVLLDSEGIDAASSVGYDDNQIFTLTVLLASVLIYNSQGVPTRRDLEGLEYPLLTLVSLYSLSYCSLSNCLVCLFACAFLGGEKNTKKCRALVNGHFIVSLFCFMIPPLFGKTSVYYARWFKRREIEGEFLFYFETVVRK